MNDLQTAIDGLTPEQVAETLKNLKISLENEWNHRVDNEEVQRTFKSMTLGEDATALQKMIVSGEGGADSLEKWGKALLVHLATDGAILPLVEEAIEDAKESSTMVGIEMTLLILGGVVVLLKWRPKSVKWSKKKGLDVKWVENDVGVVSDLAEAASSLSME